MKKSTQADLVLVGIVILWGTSFALVKTALEYVTPVLFVVLRFLVAGLIWLALYGRLLKGMTPGTWSRGILLGAVLGGGFIFQTAGLGITSASMSGFLTGLNVVIVPLIVVVFQRTIPRVPSLIGVGFCTAGLFVMMSPVGEGMNLGDLLTMACAVLFALYIVLVEIYTVEYDPRALALTQVVGMLLVSLPLMPMLEAPAVTFTPGLIWRWLALGTMAALTFALQLYWQRFLTATRAAIIFTLEPPLAALFAFLMLGEIMGGAAYIGGGIIFLGLLVAEGGAHLLQEEPAAVLLTDDDPSS